MNRFENVTRTLKWSTSLLLIALAVGCGSGGGGRDEVLGGGGAALAPRVTAVAPANNATGVPISTKIITAAFSKAMKPSTLTTTSFTLACGADGTAGTGAPETPVTGGGAVTYMAAGNVATLPLPAATDLPASADCTATITTAAKDTTGIALLNNFVWTFTTGVTPDTTRPRVSSTVPITTTPLPTPTTGAIANAAITVIFTEDMAPGSITTAGTFTVTCGPGNVLPCVEPAPVGGAATYAVGSRTATYTPTVALADSTTYTATITTAATDLALNALAGNQAALPAASNYVWTFTTAAAPALPGNISVSSTNTSCPNAVNATFTVPSGLRMNDVSVAANLSVIDAASAPVSGTVTLDAATGTIATFTPTVALTNGASYTLTITGGATGVKDNAVVPNTLNMNPYTLGFIPGPATGACTAPVALLSAAPFGTIGGAAGMTNAGNLTIVDGDIGTIATGTSSITGFHDSATPVPDSYTEVCPGTPLLATGCGLVTGRIYTCTVSSTGPTSAIAIGPATQNPVSCGIALAALLDAGTAYGALAGLAPGGASPAPGANLGSLTLLPGVYTAPGGAFLIQGGDLTLDAGGNANAVWVFKMASTLTVGGPGAASPQSIVLAGGAQAKNVFWQVGTSAVINAAGGGTMVGTIITGGSPPGIAISTSGNAAPVTLNGRAITTTMTGASVTMVNTVINVPAP